MKWLHLLLPAGAITTICAPCLADVSRAQWAIGMYLDGDNNLERRIVDDFWEVAALPNRADDDVRIEAQLDRIGRYSDDEDAPQGPATGRFRLSDPTITRPTPLGPHLSMDKGDNLTGFLDAIVAERPASFRALIVGSHGDGPRVGTPAASSTGPADLTRGGFEEEPKTRAVLFDETSHRDLSVADFADAIKSAGRVNVLGLDACLMGTLEVFVQLRDVDYIVASEHEEIAEGWDHSAWASEVLNKKGKITPPELAQSFLKSFKRSVEAAHMRFVGHTAVVVRTQSLGELARNLDEFADVLLSPGGWEPGHEIAGKAIEKALTSCGSLGVSFNSNTVDLGCFVTRARANAEAGLSKPLRARLDSAVAQMDELLCSTGQQCTKPEASAVLAREMSAALVAKDYRGVGIYFPVSRSAARTGATLESYRNGNLVFFSLVANWLRLIDRYLQYAPA